MNNLSMLNSLPFSVAPKLSRTQRLSRADSSARLLLTGVSLALPRYVRAASPFLA